MYNDVRAESALERTRNAWESTDPRHPWYNGGDYDLADEDETKYDEYERKEGY